MMPIRPAGPADTQHIVELLNLMHDESPIVSQFSFDPIKAEDVIEDILEADHDDLFMWVYVNDGKLSGLIIMEAREALFGAYTVAAEHIVYAIPEARGSFGMGRLLQTALRWAEAKGDIVRFEASSGINDDQSANEAFRRMGLRPAGTLYGKELV